MRKITISPLDYFDSSLPLHLLLIDRAIKMGAPIRYKNPWRVGELLVDNDLEVTRETVYFERDLETDMPVVRWEEE